MAWAWRVLRPRGQLWLKCQDQGVAGQQRWLHVDQLRQAELLGCIADDLLLLVRSLGPAPARWKRQLHARRNHSSLWVFRKPNTRQRRGKGEPAEPCPSSRCTGSAVTRPAAAARRRSRGPGPPSASAGSAHRAGNVPSVRRWPRRAPAVSLAGRPPLFGCTLGFPEEPLTDIAHGVAEGLPFLRRQRRVVQHFSHGLEQVVLNTRGAEQRKP